MKEESKKKDWRPIWLYLIITIVSSFLIGLIITFLSSANGNLEEYSKLIEPVSLVFSNVVISIIFLVLYHKRLKKDICRLTKKNIIYIIVSAIVIILLNELISHIFELLKIELSNQNSLNTYLLNFRIPMTLAIAIFAPFVEEMTFRYSLETVCKKDTSFIIISGLLFGIAHGVGLATTLYIFIGVCLSVIYIKTDKNIMVPIVIHILNNSVSVIEMLLLL